MSDHEDMFASDSAEPTQQSQEVVDEITRRLETLMDKLVTRREQVESVLKKPAFQPNWSDLRKRCLRYRGRRLLANDVLSNFLDDAEPIVCPYVYMYISLYQIFLMCLDKYP